MTVAWGGRVARWKTKQTPVSERLGRATWDAPADTRILAVVLIFVCLQPRSLRVCCSVMHSPPPPSPLSSPVKLCRPMLAPSAC